MRVLVVAPALNEAGKIGTVVRRVLATARHLPDEVAMLVVDDGSSDGTGEEARAAGAEVLRHASRRGVGAAIRAAFDAAVARGYDAAVVVSGDNQHDPEELPRVLEPLRHGAVLVQGSRFLPGGRSPGIARTHALAIRAYSLAFQGATGFRMTDATNGFRAVRTSFLARVLPDLRQAWLDRYELEPYLLWRAVKAHAPMVQVPVTVRHPSLRRDATKMVPVLDWWRLGRPILLLATGIRK